ncbi:hypothetical protein NMY22_g15143 [Coprinellus aureogranulatus]|nr:hypothetical protein NMY22_g15143 [Coprinellus aureogranulatus]
MGIINSRSLAPVVVRRHRHRRSPMHPRTRQAAASLVRRCTRHYSTRQAIAEKNARINAFVHINPEPSSASSSDKKGALSDLKIAVKDNIVTTDSPTTCSSAVLKNFTSPFEATVVQRLREDGADIVGKTNCDEFGMGSLNVYSVHGPTVNPFDTRERRSAGGSSGGSAAAVAMGACDA